MTPSGRRFPARRVCHVALLLTVACASAASAQAPRLTVERLKALPASGNDPAGDAFTGTPQARNALLDAMAADSSLVGPMQLLLASNTALRLERVEDAGFFLYAAQIRAAFDFERYDAPRNADGSNAATYLGFLNQTIGEQVNPAIMRDRARFAAAIARIERWDPTPAAGAYHPEFAGASLKLPQARWAASAAAIKEQFLTGFGRRTRTLLNDPEYYEAFAIVQDQMLHASGPPSDADRARATQALARMAAAEARLFPGQPTQTPAVPPDAASAPTTPASAPASPSSAADAPRRVGGGVPEPKLLRRVEPAFPSGRRGSVILEVTVGRQGKVHEVRVLRADPGLEAPAVQAVRQWIYVPVLVDGKPVSVIQTVSLSAR
jgi:TonB family protein